MTSEDEEAAAVMAADEQAIRQAKFYARSQRDCGAASAVGGGTVAISLLVGGANVGVVAFDVLFVAQAALLFAAQFFGGRSDFAIPGTVSRKANLVVSDLAPLVVIGGGTFLSHWLKQHQSNTGSTAWCLLLALAGAGSFVGLTIRRMAESRLDELDDESWKRRLLNEHRKTTGEFLTALEINDAVKAARDSADRTRQDAPATATTATATAVPAARKPPP